jgi:hypothetical protein
MYTLGINAVYHDSAACLVKDGREPTSATRATLCRAAWSQRPTASTLATSPTWGLKGYGMARATRSSALNCRLTSHLMCAGLARCIKGFSNAVRTFIAHWRRVCHSAVSA